MERENCFRPAIGDEQRYRFHADPGHGWLEVECEELRHLGIATDVSPFSYREGSTAFLEEDCDLTRFVEAKFARGEPVPYVYEHHENTPIRGYACYTP